MRKFVLILMMVAALAVPSAAAASSGYTNVAGVNEGGSDGSSGTPSAVASAGEPSSTGVLPFTGLELGLMFGAGVVLVGTGVALRRTRTHDN